MTEADKIRIGLEKRGRDAYEKAKSQDSAFIVIGNSIYRMFADGSRCKVEELPTTRVKAKQKKYIIR